MEQKIPLVVLAGPTASGKTAAGVRLCQLLDGEVVSADSMQIYRGLTVGTAKPLPEEMQGIPHHLIDFLEPTEPFSVADYVELARRTIADIHARGKLPVVVGGTGLYLSSLVDNIQFEKEDGDEQVRARLHQQAQREGAQALWERLLEVDEAAARRIHPNNVGRVVRALEVYETTGVPISRQQELSRSQPSPYRACMLALNYRDRQRLYDRINLRVGLMAQQGLIEEARQLLEHTPGALTSLQAIGYKETARYLRGEESLDEALERIRQESRRYAKRQLTWLRRDERYQWFYPDDYEQPEQMYRQMQQAVRDFLDGQTAAV